MLKIKLGDYIEQINTRNENNIFEANSVVGLSTQKEIIHTKADLEGVKLTSYKLFSPSTFAYVPDTSRRGDKVSLAYNHDDITYLVSSISIVFKVSRPDILHPDYLFMWFNRPEFDRYARFNSCGSARETFSWEDMCDIDITLPPLHIQQKYVNIYNAMLANQRCYERGLDDLKLVCDAYIEEFKHTTNRISLGDLIQEVDERNTENKITFVNGVNKEKQFMPSVANGEDLSKYKVVRKNKFACNLMHVGRDIAVPVALNNSDNPLIVSPAYIVFEVLNSKILPEFLLSWLSREETDRFAWFMSDTNVRSGMEKKRFYELDIPVPPLSEQKALVDIHKVYTLRRNINEKLQAQIKSICPILIKGSLEEGSE